MNERLGIVEQAQRKAQAFADKNPRLRRRIFGEPPPAISGEAHPAVEPAKSTVRLRAAPKPPYWHARHIEGRGRRRTHAECDDLDVSPLQVVAAVSRITHSSYGELCGPSQKKQHARPRQLAIYFIGRYCRELSLSQIAYIFDRHHTTIMNALTCVQKRYDANHAWTTGMVGKVEAVLREKL